jgi:hypothetical protein
MLPHSASAASTARSVPLLGSDAGFLDRFGLEGPILSRDERNASFSCHGLQIRKHLSRCALVVDNTMPLFLLIAPDFGAPFLEPKHARRRIWWHMLARWHPDNLALKQKNLFAVVGIADSPMKETLLQLCRDAAEGRVQLGADAVHDGNDCNGDAGGDQPVFDGRRSGIIIQKPGEKLRH